MVLKFEDMVRNKAREMSSKSSRSSLSSSSSSALSSLSRIIIEIEVKSQKTDDSKSFWLLLGYKWKEVDQDLLHKFFIV